MFKFGDKVIIRDGTRLDGTMGIVYRIEEGRISVLLDKEVIWHVDSGKLEPAPLARPDVLPVI